MNFMFLTLPADPMSYLKEKFLSDSGDDSTHKAIANMLENNSQNVSKPEFAAASIFFELDAKQMKLIAIAKRCAIQTLAEQFPLNEGEEVIDDFFSYLLSPWEDLPKHTAVLRRKTNQAEMLFFFKQVRIEASGIVYVGYQTPVIEGGRKLKSLSMSVVSKFVKKALGKAGSSIGGAIAEKVGAVVMKLVMKEVFGIDDDATQIINEVKKIVNEEIETNEISRVMGIIDGTIQYMIVEYHNKRRKADLTNREARKELSHSIENYSNKFYTGVIGLLRQEKYAERGLRTFAFGATVHLLLTQELAVVDPDEMDPNKSSYLETLRTNAANYKAHVESVYSRAMSARDNFSVYSEETYTDTGTRFVRSIQWYWKDNFLNKRHGPIGPSKNPDQSAEQNANTAMQAFRTQALADKRNQLGNPKESFLNVIDGVINFKFE